MLSLSLPTNLHRHVAVSLLRSSYDCSEAVRHRVPRSEDLTDLQGGAVFDLAGHRLHEADPKREKLWEAHGFTLPKTSTVADLRAAISREARIEPDK